MMTICFSFYLFILFEELKESQESCLSPLYVTHTFLFLRILFKEKNWRITTIEHVKDIKLDNRYEQWWAKLLRLLTVNSLSYFVKIKY
jgi:hypothetical protein